MPRQRRGRAVASALLERGVASAALLQLDAGAVVARRGWPRAHSQAREAPVRHAGRVRILHPRARRLMLDGAQAVTAGSHHVKTRARLTTGTRGGHSHHPRGWGGPRAARVLRGAHCRAGGLGSEVGCGVFLGCIHHTRPPQTPRTSAVPEAPNPGDAQRWALLHLTSISAPARTPPPPQPTRKQSGGSARARAPRRRARSERAARSVV